MGQVLAIVSGKGGTGKTSICAGIAAALARSGQKVLCIDADVGLRNLDLSLGLANEPALPFTAVMRGEYPLSRALSHPSLPGLSFLTAPVTEQPEDLDPEEFHRMISEARQQFDWCMIDAPAGIGAGFALAVQDADLAIVVTGGDPSALRDGARTAQALDSCSNAQARLVVNRIRRRLFRRANYTVDDCMDQIGLQLLGIVPEDEAVTLAACRNQLLYPASRKDAATACANIASRLRGQKTPLLKL